MITPFAPRAPYSALEAASLSTVMDSMSAGLISFMLPGYGTPSTTYSGLLPALREPMPRTTMLGVASNEPEDVVICTPATTPSSARVASDDCTFEMSDDLIEKLNGIKNGFYDVVIITPDILFSKFPNPDSIQELIIKKGDELDVTKLSKKLISLGYERVELVSKKGQFTLRGDVLDIHPIGGNPTRIMTSFDEVESIRLYNPVTLLTTSELDECRMLKNKYYSVSKEDICRVYEEKKL